MHLTNSAINRFSENYAVGGSGCGAGVGDGDDAHDETGSKRSLKWFLRWVAQRYGEAAAERLWQEMGELCVKTVLSILPTLVRDYTSLFGEDNGGDEDSKSSSSSSSSVQGSRAFEILGIDIMVDQALKPWIIEVNTLPSFATDSSVDRHVKQDLIEQTLRAVQAKASDQRSFQARRKTQSEERLHRHRQRTDALSNALRDEANVVVQTRRKIEKLLRQHAPDRLGMIGKLMSKNKGREASLLGRLMRHFQHPGSSAGPTLHRDSASVSAAARGVTDFAEVEEAARCLSPGSSSLSSLSSSSSSSSCSLFAAQPEEPEDGLEDAAEGCSQEEEDVDELIGSLRDEATVLKGFEQIYPVQTGAVDMYAPLVEYVWEREHKLLRGNRGLSHRPGSALNTLQRKRLQSFMSTSSSAPAEERRGEPRSSEQGGDDEHEDMHRRVDDKQDSDDALAVLDLLNRRTSASRQGRAVTASEDDGKLDALLLNLVSDGGSGGGRVYSQRRRSSSTASSCCSTSVTSSSSQTQQRAAAERLMNGHSSSSKGQGKKNVRAGAAPQLPPLLTPKPARRPPGGSRSGYVAMAPKVLDLASLVTF